MRMLFVLTGGAVFGFGLALSGMIKPEVVLSFLRLEDLGLLLVMGGAVGVATISIMLGPRILNRPLIGSFEASQKSLNKGTIIGAVLFGLGWGISGACPGAALASVGVGNYPIFISLAGMFAGAYVQGRFFEGPSGRGRSDVG